MNPPKIAPSSSQSSSQVSNMPAIPFNRILSPVEYNNLKFLILDCPTDTTLPLYLAEMKSRQVTDVVRVCEPTYNKSILEENGIQVHDWPFKDGGIPSNEIILNFLGLCDERFGGLLNPTGNKEGHCIAVHCVAGLGRAPVLVAIALIESGKAPLDTVEFVRQRRRGALNTVQLQYLMDTYKRQWAKKASKFKGTKRTGSPTTTSPGTNGQTGHSKDGSASPGMTFKESISNFFRFSKKPGKSDAVDV